MLSFSDNSDEAKVVLLYYRFNIYRKVTAGKTMSDIEKYFINHKDKHVEIKYIFSDLISEIADAFNVNYKGGHKTIIYGDPKLIGTIPDDARNTKITPLLSNLYYPSVRTVITDLEKFIISEEYYYEGELHRINGPARYDYLYGKNEEYYFHGKRIGCNLDLYTKEDFENYLMLL